MARVILAAMNQVHKGENMPKKPTAGSFKAKSVFIDTKPTTYNTRFRPTALQQVVDKINSDGLPLLLSHDTSSLPIGAWYSAEVDAEDQVVSKFFIPKEISEYEDVSTRIDTGILDSVSIGFSSGVHDCSICGNDIQDYEACPHIPGRTYEAKDPISGTSLGEQTCYVMLDDISPKEGSLVYSGAVQNAKIIDSSDKAEFFAKNDFNFAEGQLEVVHGGKFLQDNNEQNNNGSSPMDEKLLALTTKFNDLQTKFNDLKSANLELQSKALDDKVKLDSYADLETQVTAANEKVESLTATYSDQIKSLGEKVEALAAPFDVDYKAPEDMDQLLKDLDTYMEKAKALPSGRQTQDTEDDVVYSMPESAYQV
jgi:hypothetical protein